MDDYSEMKATKVSKTDKAKDAIGSIAEKISKNSSSGSRKRSSSKSGTRRSTSSKSSSTRKSSNSSKSSTTGTTKRKYTRRKKPETLAEKIADKISDSINDYGSGSTPPPKKPNNKKSGSDSNYNPGNNVKKVRMGIIISCVIIFLIIGVVGGFFGTKLITKNDTYEMVCYENGQIDIVIGEDEEFNRYTELGVKCVAFGKDCSDKYTVTYYYRNDLSEEAVQVENVDTSVEGMYYAVYKAPSKKYSTVKLIRNIIVERSET